MSIELSRVEYNYEYLDTAKLRTLLFRHDYWLRFQCLLLGTVSWFFICLAFCVGLRPWFLKAASFFAVICIGLLAR